MESLSFFKQKISKFLVIFALVVPFCLFFSCNQSSSSPIVTSLFVATDRHNSDAGNNLEAAVKCVAEQSCVTIPTTVLLGGDYVGSGRNRTPDFSIEELKIEIFSVLDKNSTDAYFTYGSHDSNCEEGYSAFFTGPKKVNNYYIYGITYIQMVYSTDEQAQEAIDLASSDDSSSSSVRPYTGIDADNGFGISAESASANFLSWVNSLNDTYPIVLMSHVPLHVHRGDNFGAEKWFQALEKAAETHDIIFFFGHNHTLEERSRDESGVTIEQDVYLLLSGDSIDVQGATKDETQTHVLNFTYANAGYLKLGFCTLVTFIDGDGDGQHDFVQLYRFNALGDDPEKFGQTEYKNPRNIKLSK